MVEVNVRDGENLERALRRFRRKLIRSGLFKDMRRHRYYEKPSAAKRRKAAAARRRKLRTARRRARQT